MSECHYVVVITRKNRFLRNLASFVVSFLLNGMPSFFSE